MSIRFKTREKSRNKPQPLSLWQFKVFFYVDSPIHIQVFRAHYLLHLIVHSVKKCDLVLDFASIAFSSALYFTSRLRNLQAKRRTNIFGINIVYLSIYINIYTCCGWLMDIWSTSYHSRGCEQRECSYRHKVEAFQWRSHNVRSFERVWYSKYKYSMLNI